MTTVSTNNIIIIEDDGDLVKDILAIWNPPCPVVVASTGREAFMCLRDCRPSLVILDLCLPHYLARIDELEGFEILSYIMLRFDREIPVLVISGDTSQETRSRVSSLGASYFMKKPFEITELDCVVEQLLKQKGGA